MKRKSNSKSKRTFFLMLFLAGLVLLVFGTVGTYNLISGLGSQGYSVTSLATDTVYIPIFTNTECTVISPDYTETYDWSTRQDGDGWITEYCSRNNHQVYTNRCELELIRADEGFFSSVAEITDFYVCPVGTSFDQRNEKCSKKNGVAGAISFTNKEFVFARARDFGGLGEVESGEITIKKVADWYGLKSIDSNNYLSKEITCDVSRIKDEGFTFLKEEKQEKAPSGVLEFNQVMNYISASRPAVSKNIIDYDGREVWTIGNQEYCNIKTDEDGIRFVDITDCKTASDLVCNPALSYCSDDGTEIINIDSTGGSDGGKTCNELYGSFLSQYVPNPSNPKQVCITDCVNGELVQSSCKYIPECKEGILNSEYVCVQADVPEDGEGESESYLPLFILAGSIVLVGLTRKKALEGD